MFPRDKFPPQIHSVTFIISFQFPSNTNLQIATSQIYMFLFLKITNWHYSQMINTGYKITNLHPETKTNCFIHYNMLHLQSINQLLQQNAKCRQNMPPSSTLNGTPSYIASSVPNSGQITRRWHRHILPSKVGK